MPMVKVAEVGQVAPGTGRVVEVGGRTIALYNVDGSFYALDDTCTHRGGPLGLGRLRGTIVTCPWHGMQFDVRTGCGVSDLSTPVRTYAVHVRAGDVLIDLA